MHGPWYCLGRDGGEGHVFIKMLSNAPGRDMLKNAIRKGGSRITGGFGCSLMWVLGIILFGYGR